MHVGPLLEDIPSIAHASMTTLDSNTLVGILWEAVRTLSRRVEYQNRELADLTEYLEGRIDTLTEND
jgi:hypothetical protein